ncbi:MAG: isocitrate lyase/phosphoenolpyruvate mutase family protein [Acidobacteriota bacterium]
MTSFRDLLARDGPVTLIGAHSALTARLGEEAGFDGIWASGFEISASRGVPDANYLTMTEALAVAREMAGAVSIPVIADCDNGFGNAINVMRTVREYEAAGVAGICVEDNVFPKRCSFYGGVRRELVPAEEHAGKIRACKSAQRTPDFAVVARTEAFIAGWGKEEALARAHLYADSGADLVLVHSRSKTFDELADFARSWDRATPLVVVPTIFSATAVDELHSGGFKVVIFANHALRAEVKAVRETLAALRRAGRASAIEDRIATLEEVYKLSGVTDLSASEKLYLPKGDPPARAVILAAGYEESLQPLIADRPKAMLDVKGATLLERQVATLAACGIREIAVVRGYLKDRITLAGLHYVDNDLYRETGELHSLLCAASFFGDRTLVLYGDLLFDEAIVRKMLATPGDVLLAIDRAYPDAVRAGLPLPARPDLVVFAGEGTDAPALRDLAAGETRRVARIGSRIASTEAHGEFLGIALLTRAGSDRLRARVAEVSERLRGKPFHEAASMERAALSDAFQEAIDAGEEVRAVETYKGWMEVDTFEDYQRAWARLR